MLLGHPPSPRQHTRPGCETRRGRGNPFTEFRNNREELYGDGFIQLIDKQTYFRSFTFSANYRFGKLKETVRKNKRGINNDDTSD